MDDGFSDEYLNEPKITAAELMAEIKLLLDEVYEGGIYLEGNKITYMMPNGQVFKICATEQ